MEKNKNESHADAWHFPEELSGCFNCGSCWQVCGTGALSPKRSAQGFWYPQIRYDRCVRCRRCEAACPMIHPVPGHGAEPERSFWLARHRQLERRQRSASGGFFGALGDVVLARGGVVFGVRMARNFSAEVASAENREALLALCGSKYVASYNREEYRRVRQALAAKRPVLFAGTPCMIAGLRRYLGGDDPLLLTLDLVCHGVPAPSVFRRYLAELARRFDSPVASVRFHGKQGKWEDSELDVVFRNGHNFREPAHRNLYLQGFLSGLFTRQSCYDCRYVKLENRVADLTVGDAWRGGTLEPEFEDHTGISGVIVHTAKGRAWFEACVAAGELAVRECDCGLIDSRYLHAPVNRHPDRARFFYAMGKIGVGMALVVYARVLPRMRCGAQWFKSRLRRLMKIK